LVVPSATTHYSFFEVNFSTHGLRKIVSPETESITLALDGIPVTSTNEELSDKAYNSCLRASANRPSSTAARNKPWITPDKRLRPPASTLRTAGEDPALGV
jgi:hypothetical protein